MKKATKQAKKNSSLIETGIKHQAVHVGFFKIVAICLIISGIGVLYYGRQGIVFAADADWTAFANGIAYVNGNVGIGTPNPLFKLQIKIGTDQNLQFRSSPSMTGGVMINAANDANNANIPLEIVGSNVGFTVGNVGIGTANPLYKLQVKTGTNQNFQFRPSSGVSGGVMINAANDANNANIPLEIVGNKVIFPVGDIGIGTPNPLYKLQVKTGTNQNLQFRPASSMTGGVMINAANDANNANIPLEIVGSKIGFTAGDVGIGTPNPLYKLQVKTGTNQNLQFRSAATMTGGVMINAANDANNANVPLEIIGSKVGFTVGNVGIGTPNPLYKLQVKTGTNQNLQFRPSGSMAGGIMINAANDANNANVPLEIIGSKVGFTVGNIGIGTPNPLYKLHIKVGPNQNLQFRPSSGVSGGVMINAANDANNVNIPLELNGSTVFMPGGTMVLGNGSVGNGASFVPIQMWNGGNATGAKSYRLGFDNNRLTFQSTNDSGNFAQNQLAIYPRTGNVSIGVAVNDNSIAEKLYVNGKIKSSNAMLSDVGFLTPGKIAVGVGNQDMTGINEQLYVSGKIKSSNVMLSDAGFLTPGKVAIGVPNQDTTGINEQLYVVGKIKANNVIISDTGLITAGKVAIGVPNQDTTGINEQLYVGGTVKAAGAISSDGKMIALGGFDCASDQRLKKDIKPIPDALGKILQLSGVYFNWNREKYPELVLSKDHQIGLIAQQVEKVAPELVSTGDNGYKVMNYDGLSALVVNAIKEQQQQIEQLKRENQELKQLIIKSCN